MFSLVFVLVSDLVSAHHFVAHVTRLGGDTAAAQPFIDKFSRYVEGKMGWEAGSVSGKFFPSKAEAVQYIDAQKPTFGMLEPALYFELRKSKQLQPLVQIQSKELVWTKLNVVAKGAASLDELKGKTLCAMGADSPRYLSKYVFAGKIDAATHFQLKPIGQALKGIRSVLKGECDATLLDEDMLTAAAKMEGGGELKSVYTSPALPPTPFVTIGKGVSAEERKKLTSVLLAMCEDAEGKAVCQDMRVEKFVPADKKALQ